MILSVRRSAVTVVGAIVLAACSNGSGDSAVVADPDETAPPSPGATVAPVTSNDSPSETTPSPTTTAANDTPVSTLALSSTDPARWEDLIGPTCDVLRSEGYETRQAQIAEFRRAAERVDARDTADGAMAAACTTEFEATIAAIELQERRDELDALDEPVEFSQIECADGNYQFVVSNITDSTIGVHVAFRIFLGDDDEPASSADYPIVIWQLEPGAAQGITGTFSEPETADYRCSLIARIFDGSTEDVGAGLPGVTDPALTGDDPSQWFGELLGREVDTVGSGDRDGAAVTEDLRSMFYDNVLAFALGDEPSDRVPTSVTVCNRGLDRPDDDRLSMVYFIVYPTDDGRTEGFLRHGLFRRGVDGQWRWLSAAHYFDSPEFWQCGRPGIQR